MMKKMILSPSLLASDFGNLESELKDLEQAGLNWVHWDVMDGMFVPNITFGADVIKRLRKNSKLFFDVHLMIEKPERYIDDFVNAGADLICVHAEATVHLERVLSAIKEKGKKCAVALNPATPLDVLRYILPQLDMVLIMSVNPGFGGQKFIPFSLQKIQQLATMIRAKSLDTLIQVDGGVTPENTKQLVELGANVLVSGSAFFGYPPYKQRLEQFEQAVEA